MRVRLLSALALLGGAACATTPSPAVRPALAAAAETPAQASDAEVAPQAAGAEVKAAAQAAAATSPGFTPEQVREQEATFARAHEASARRDFVQAERELKALL